ncbi:proton-conducting transporter membrane subunit [Alteromonas facilis]|uniref:proton-conducting transporter transmembrane domain-containing protein n=1 Tax=Alteromonas facilis TaxID=2048004 RepID=UPI000C282B5C|nr:proton-conducting transporter membrane subunit [Alteromonas facilis]
MAFLFALENLLLMAFFIPLVGALIISRLDLEPNVREGVTLITAGLLLTVNVLIYLSLPEASDFKMTVAEPMPGISIAFAVESFGVMFALIASGLWIVTSIYAIGYMRGHHEENQTRFFTLFAIALAGVMAIAYSANLFTLFLFYEVLTVSTYPLVTHAGTSKARKGGRTYLTLLMGSSIVFFLPAIIIVYVTTGTLDFQSGGFLDGKLDAAWLAPLMLLFLLGIGKAGMMPMHKWLPSAMVAPTPVSALLHAVAVVKAGVFSILKIVMFVVGPDFLSQTASAHWLLWLPMITIVVASLIAMTKDNIKERLAYSTISQLSYIILGALLANSLGLLGGSLHIAMHAFAKITLFFAAGAILVATHKTQVSELDGLGRYMPITFTLFFVATLSIIGIPLLGGMWSKWYLMSGASAFSGNEVIGWALLLTLMISSLLNIAYLLVIPVRAFFAKPVSTKIYSEAPLPCLIGMIVPAALCIYLFFAPEVFYQLANAALPAELQVPFSSLSAGE